MRSQPRAYGLQTALTFVTWNYAVVNGTRGVPGVESHAIRAGREHGVLRGDSLELDGLGRSLASAHRGRGERRPYEEKGKGHGYGGAENPKINRAGR
jgi:hypothetical protein